MADEEVNQTEEAPLDQEELEDQKNQVLEEPDFDAEETGPEELDTPTDMSDPAVGIVDDKGSLQKMIDEDDERLQQDDGTPVEMESVR